MSNSEESRWSIDQIKELFCSEFRHVKDKFKVHVLPISLAQDKANNELVRGGVYVWWNNGLVFKVGRHLVNTRKRAFEHLRDNTGGKIAALANDTNTLLLLFNVKYENDLHWTLALEYYFEMKLKPEVRSKRIG